MKKLVTVLCTAVALAFSSAAMSGVCTKEKLEGRYVISGTINENNWNHGEAVIYRIFLNKIGRGKVIAWAETDKGFIESDQVHWPVEWDVAEDCTGNIFIANGVGGIYGLFAASGSTNAPVLNGVARNPRSVLAGSFRAERVDF